MNEYSLAKVQLDNMPKQHHAFRYTFPYTLFPAPSAPTQ